MGEEEMKGEIGSYWKQKLVKGREVESGGEMRGVEEY